MRFSRLAQPGQIKGGDKPASGGFVERELKWGRLAMIATYVVLVARMSGSLLGGSPEHVAALGVTLIFGGVIWAWFWWRLAAGPDSRAHGVAVVGMTLWALAIIWITPLGLFPFHYSVILAGAAYRWRVGSVLAACVVLVESGVWLTTELGQLWTLQSLAITALLGGGAVIARRYVGIQIELDQTREELRELAAAEARAKLAGDLHDQIGQQLTATVMQGELLLMDLEGLAPTPLVSDMSRRAELIVDSSREALTLMREMVSASRQPSVHSEVAVAQTLLKATGITCDAELPAAPLPPQADKVFGWVVREGVTNVMRHSGARRCSIVVDLRDDRHVLRIRDDGRGAADSHSAGTGIASMASRLAEVGGHLQVQGADGFELTATVPAAKQ